MKLTKTISVVCAALIALTTIIYTALPAFASTDEEIVPSSAEEIAELLYDSIYSGSDYLGVKPTFTAFFEELIEVGWYYSEDVLALIDPTSDYQYSRGGGGGLIRSGSGGGGGRLRVDSADDVVIGTETFAEIIDRLNQQYGNTAKKYISLNTDIRWKTANVDGTNRYLQISWYQAGTFCNQSTWSQVYMVPFYYDADNDMMWYGLNQLHYTQTVETVDGVNSIYMDCEVTNFVDPDYSFTTRVLDGYGDPCDFALHRYSDIIVDSSSDSRMNGLMGWIYNTYSEYIACYREGTPACVTMYDTDTNTITKFCHLFSASDLASDIYTKNSWTGDKTKYCYPASNYYKEGHDIGYLVSNEPIKLGFDWTGIDPTKIEDDGTVSMGGTTINEYIITNKDGNSTTINNYITNNYYIEGGESDDSGDTTINNWNVSFGDFVLEIGATIETSIQNTFNFLFVPSDSFFDNKVSDLKTEFQAKLPIAADLPDVFSELFVNMDEEGNIIPSVLNSSLSDDEASESEGEQYDDEDVDSANPTLRPGITYDEDGHALYPKWEIDISFFGQDMKLTVLDFQTFKAVLPTVRTVILVFVYVVYIVKFINYLPTLVGNLASMGGSVVSATSKLSEKGDE